MFFNIITILLSLVYQNYFPMRFNFVLINFNFIRAFSALAVWLVTFGLFLRLLGGLYIQLLVKAFHPFMFLLKIITVILFIFLNILPVLFKFCREFLILLKVHGLLHVLVLFIHFIHFNFLFIVRLFLIKFLNMLEFRFLGLVFFNWWDLFIEMLEHDLHALPALSRLFLHPSLEILFLLCLHLFPFLFY